MQIRYVKPREKLKDLGVLETISGEKLLTATYGKKTVITVFDDNYMKRVFSPMSKFFGKVLIAS